MAKITPMKTNSTFHILNVFVNGNKIDPKEYTISENGMVIFNRTLSEMFPDVKPTPDQAYPFWVVVEYEGW